mgnify:CR=1 FL=1
MFGKNKDAMLFTQKEEELEIQREKIKKEVEWGIVGD